MITNTLRDAKGEKDANSGSNYIKGERRSCRFATISENGEVTMRNVITLSDIPKELHSWLKQEATRQSSLTGKRVGIYQVVVQAVREYKRRLENNAGKTKRANVPTMEMFRKKLQPAELESRRLCVPRSKWHFFGGVGNIITIKDGQDGSDCRVTVGSQYRLRMSDWYSRHKDVEPGDEIVFEQTDGTISVRVVST